MMKTYLRNVENAAQADNSGYIFNGDYNELSEMQLRQLLAACGGDPQPLVNKAEFVAEAHRLVPNHDDVRKILSNDITLTDSKKIACPKDCYQQLKRHFDTEAWRTKQAQKGKPMARITVHWTGPAEVQRPRTDEVYYGITDIAKSHQFFVVGTGRVATRNHSCWCPACHTQVTKGGADADFQTRDFRVPCCIHARELFYKWRNESCAQKEGSSVTAAWDKAKKSRAAIAKELTRGEWCVVLAPDDDDEEFWLARTVARGDWDGRCTRVHSSTTTINGTRYDNGDVEIALRWYGLWFMILRLVRALLWPFAFG